MANWLGMADLIGSSFGAGFQRGTEQGLNQVEREKELALRQKLAIEQAVKQQEALNKYQGGLLADYMNNSLKQGTDYQDIANNRVQLEQMQNANPINTGKSTLLNTNAMNNAVANAFNTGTSRNNVGTTQDMQGLINQIYSNNQGNNADYRLANGSNVFNNAVAQAYNDSLNTRDNIYSQGVSPLNVPQETLDRYSGYANNPFQDVNVYLNNPATKEQQQLMDLARQGNVFAINEIQNQMKPTEMQIGTRQVFDPNTNLTRQQTYMYGVDKDGNYQEQVVNENITGKDWTPYKAEQERMLAQNKQQYDYNQWQAELKAKYDLLNKEYQYKQKLEKMKQEGKGGTGGKDELSEVILPANQFNEVMALNPNLSLQSREMLNNVNRSGDGGMVEFLAKYIEADPVNLSTIKKKNYWWEDDYKADLEKAKQNNKNIQYARQYLKDKYNYDPFLPKAVNLLQQSGITAQQNKDGSYTLINQDGETYTAKQDELVNNYLSDMGMQ